MIRVNSGLVFRVFFQAGIAQSNQQALFTQAVLTCHSSKCTGVNNKINDD